MTLFCTTFCNFVYLKFDGLSKLRKFVNNEVFPTNSEYDVSSMMCAISFQVFKRDVPVHSDLHKHRIFRLL